MKRVLSSIGIGAASVDTILPRTELHPGEQVEADVEMIGGDSTQEIDGIYFSLEAQVDGETVVLDEFDVADSFTLEPDEEQTISTTFQLPYWTPITRGGPTVSLKTGLDIDWAVDPTDEDALEVVPDEFVTALFDAVEEMGFVYDHVGIEESPWLDRQPFVQEFQFVPRSGDHVGSLDELTVMCVPRGDDMRVFVEIDKNDPVEDLSEFDFDEQEVALTFDRADPDMMRRRIRNNIERHT